MIFGKNLLLRCGRGVRRKRVKLPFLKPGKDPNLPSSYCPISLTSCICKLFERMVNHRLMWFLEKNNILCPEQSGFRKHSSTIDALTQQTCHIDKGFKGKKHIVSVFFDLKKAYDTVWRAEILNYMHEMGLRGNLSAFAEGFLSSREFCVRVGTSHSEYFVQEEGLPQGSVLSVTLCAIAINEITKQLGSEVHCTLYMDNFTIFVSAATITHSTRIIQIAINNVEQWMKTKGMRFSTEKTVAIKCEKRKKGEEPQLTLHGSRVQVRESTHYLGLIIDKRLNWKDHMDHLRAKCTFSVNLIKHVSHLSWGADRKMLQRLYTALVQSKLNYGASKSNVLKCLEPIQNACLRAITGAFQSSPAVSLCVETGMLPLDFSRDMLTLKHFFKIQSLSNSPTHRAVIGPLGDPTPRMEHINELCTQYQVQTPKILTTVVPEIPSWTYPPIRICPFLETKKQGLLNKEM